MSAESTSFDPYEAVLADLKARRDQLDQAIEAIEAIRGGASVSGVAVPPGAPAEGPGAYLGMSISDAAKKLLAARRQPLRNPEIAQAFKRGGLVLNSAEPVNTIGSVLTRRFNEVGDIVKVGRGTWGLKEWYPGRSFKSKGENGDAKASSSEPAQPSKQKPAAEKQ